MSYLSRHNFTWLNVCLQDTSIFMCEAHCWWSRYLGPSGYLGILDNLRPTRILRAPRHLQIQIHNVGLWGTTMCGTSRLSKFASPCITYHWPWSHKLALAALKYAGFVHFNIVCVYPEVSGTFIIISLLTQWHCNAVRNSRLFETINQQRCRQVSYRDEV